MVEDSSSLKFFLRNTKAYAQPAKKIMLLITVICKVTANRFLALCAAGAGLWTLRTFVIILQTPNSFAVAAIWSSVQSVCRTEDPADAHPTFWVYWPPVCRSEVLNMRPGGHLQPSEGTNLACQHRRSMQMEALSTFLTSS